MTKPIDLSTLTPQSGLEKIALHEHWRLLNVGKSLQHPKTIESYRVINEALSHQALWAPRLVDFRNFHDKLDTTGNARRIGMTKLDSADQGEHELGDHLESVLKNAKAKLPRFSLNKQVRAARKQLNTAMEDTKERQDRRAVEFLYDAQHQLLLSMQASLANENNEPAHTLRTKITAALAVTDQDMQFRSDALDQHKRAGELADAVEAYAKKRDNEPLAADAMKYSVLSKRWADVHYNNPRQKTNLEKVRSVVKKVSLGLAFGFAAAALVSSFLFPPLALGFSLASLVGAWPVLDTLGDVARDAWHGRAPTVGQAKELGWSLPFIAYGVGLIHGLVSGVSAIASAAESLAGKLIHLFSSAESGALSLPSREKSLELPKAAASTYSNTASVMNQRAAAPVRRVSVPEKPTMTFAQIVGAQAVKDAAELATESPVESKVNLSIMPQETANRLKEMRLQEQQYGGTSLKSGKNTAEISSRLRDNTSTFFQAKKQASQPAPTNRPVPSPQSRPLLDEKHQARNRPRPGPSRG